MLCPPWYPALLRKVPAVTVHVAIALIKRRMATEF